MVCKCCPSVNQEEFLAEVNIHFPGKESLTKPAVWVFPRLQICMNCGLAQFSLGDPELTQLRDSDSRAEAEAMAA
ncbi:MAG TPA: hypothetical protein VH437_01500 [Terriglobales bacterium]